MTSSQDVFKPEKEVSELQCKTTSLKVFGQQLIEPIEYIQCTFSLPKVFHLTKTSLFVLYLVVCVPSSFTYISAACFTLVVFLLLCGCLHSVALSRCAVG